MPLYDECGFQQEVKMNFESRIFVIWNISLLICETEHIVKTLKAGADDANTRGLDYGSWQGIFY